MKRKILLFCPIVATCLFANDLQKEAFDAGLLPIPSDSKALNNLINEVALDAKEFPSTSERIELGKKLYFDPRLSKSGIISCNTCHNLGLGGSDNIPASTGHKWTPNPHHINAPSVYNSVFNSVQFWDGRANHLAEQAGGPMTADPEMASTKELVVDRLNSMPEYKADFKKAFSSDIKFELVTAAIGIFERTLVTPSRFDKFLQGDKKALSKNEQDGLKIFIDKGCATCHNGINLGGTMQPFEVVGKYEFANVGDFKGDANGLVKTPTLRNVELTPPYFHNGAIWSLKDAIKAMGSIQLGIEISEEEAIRMVEFLKSLTGKMPKIEYPMLPIQNESMPKPELNY